MSVLLTGVVVAMPLLRSSAQPTCAMRRGAAVHAKREACLLENSDPGGVGGVAMHRMATPPARGGRARGPPRVLLD